MRRIPFRSFRARLFVSLLAATLVPLLVCSAVLLQTFRARLTSSAQEEARVYLDSALNSLDTVYERFSQAAAAVEADRVIAAALAGEAAAETAVNSRLFSATGQAREYARFDLYDAGGTWRYSTQGPPREETLPTHWGVLGAADREEGLTFLTSGETGDAGTPRLLGVVLLTGQEDETVGYLVISLYQSHLRLLLEGKYGGQNDLVLFSRYWRPVYCAQPTLADALGPVLRERLLAGEALADPTGEFTYSVACHEDTGLYILLRQPQVFTRDTMGLSYTLSAGVGLVCIVFSLALSFALSRQLSLPVRRLTRAIGEVGHNNLDVQVAPAGDDELGQLAVRFNDMVAALKRNQEELVANQRELNEAQIRMLQAQLNPHFLGNTLDTMKWISKINRVPQVAEMSANLADILRYSISPDELVPLWRDEEILERYIEIQTIRLSGGFSFSADIPEELADCLVPKLILQPIVENAILHGLDGVDGGVIEVAVRERDGKLVITVSDNGHGLPEELVGPYASRGKPEGHLGLYNVDTILRKYYGEGFGLTLANRPAGGAVVTAVLPVRREEEEEPC